MCSVVEECSLANVTFGHGGEIDSGFLQQVSYDERDWVFGTSTNTSGTGPDEDHTEGDADGLFAYLEGDCDPSAQYQTECESERVNISALVYLFIQTYHRQALFYCMAGKFGRKKVW